VSFFPQLVAGPIVRARDFIPQIRKPLFVSQEVERRIIENTFYKVDTDIIGDDCFLKQTGENQEDSPEATEKENSVSI